MDCKDCVHSGQAEDPLYGRVKCCQFKSLAILNSFEGRDHGAEAGTVEELNIAEVQDDPGRTIFTKCAHFIFELDGASRVYPVLVNTYDPHVIIILMLKFHMSYLCCSLALDPRGEFLPMSF